MSNSSSTTKKIDGEIDRFTDILHHYDDDIDENIDADVDFDAFFTDFDKNEEEPESKDIPWINPSVIVKTISQKRPTLTPTTPTVEFIKKFKSHECEEEILPKYLSTTNKLFEDSIMPLIPQDATISIHTLIEELRQLTFFEHQLQITNLDIELWTVYLQSGTGKLAVGLGNGDNEVDKRSILQQLQYPLATPPSIWSEKLKSLILNDPDVLPAVKNNIDNSVYLNYVNQMLTQFRQDSLLYQRQIEEKRQYLQVNVTLDIDLMIKKLVQDYGTTHYNIVNEGFIAAVKFTYKDRIVEMQFEQEDVMHEYTQEFRLLTKSKTIAEKAKMELEMLKQRVAHKHTACMFNSFQVPVPSDLETIQDDTLRQRILSRYDQLIQRTKSELTLIHIHIADVKAYELNKEFENNYKLFFQKLRTSHSSSGFKQRLTEIIGQRFDLINQRLQTLLDLKVRFFVKAPTVKRII